MGQAIEVLEPVPDEAGGADQQLAARLSSLEGKTLLLLDNQKPNALALLTKAGEILKQRHGLRDVICVSKNPDYSRTVTREALGANIGKAHLAITALGD
ncbi:MAG: hypothetical protein IT531_06860 [Burkholderiales bacterium]|nr:hypothetical protein [Burkholderiales bacterium]